jgi:DNA polymerase-3 subunit alpha
MGKKKPEVMLKFKDKFIKGAEAQGYQAKFAKELFETMEYFAGYGFNKSHSTAYALVTYQTAWLKAHYPTEFIAANLTTESGNSDKIKEFVDDVRRADMKILPPSVNHSMRYFGIEDGAIRFGLGAIKGVGTRVADAIAENRVANGPYSNLDDFCERLDTTVLNKTALESLVQSGGFDDMGRTRAGNAAQIEKAVRAAATAREDRRRGQAMLFAPPPVETVLDEENGIPEWPEHDRLAREKESLGFYLSGHPFEKRGAFLRRIAGNTTASVAQLQPSENIRIAGMISGVRILQIKQGKNAGKKMAKFMLEDLDGMVPVTCFARSFETLKDHIVEDEIVFLTGRQDKGSEEPALLLDALDPASVVVRREVSGIVLHLDASMSTDVFLTRVIAIADKHSGNHQLNLDVEDGGDCFRIRADSGVAISDELIDSFAVLVGPDNMSFTRM